MSTRLRPRWREPRGTVASRSIQDLDPRVVQMAGAVLAGWKAAGLDILVTCTFRSDEEQSRLYEVGRVTPGNIVTYAKAGQSLHNHGLALDFVPMAHGKPIWDAESPLWEKAARLAQRIDSRIAWGGDWTAKKVDRPHLEWSLGNLGSRIT